MKNLLVSVLLLIFSQSSVAADIDLSRWADMATVPEACPEDSIIYEENPASGLRTLLCHSLALWPIDVLQQMSGKAVFISGPHSSFGLNLKSDTSFGHYNPKFIDWAIKNLIPNFENREQNLIWQGLYEGYLKQVTRALMTTFYDLETHDDYRKLVIAKYQEDYSRLRDSHGKRWETINGARGVDGAQMYRFWVRRYIDGTATTIGRQLEKLFIVFDSEFLNATRTEYGLGRMTPVIEAKKLTDDNLNANFIILEAISDRDEKINYLESIRYKYTIPAHVSRILIALGDLKPRYLDPGELKLESAIDTGPDADYFEQYGSKGLRYSGSDYYQVVKRFPGTEYAAEAAYKILTTIYEGGVGCEGDFLCEFERPTRRSIAFIKTYPQSKYAPRFLESLETSFEQYINFIQFEKNDGNYEQQSLRKVLGQTLANLLKGAELSTDEVKSFSGYYNGLYHLKIRDVNSAEKFFESAINSKNSSDNKYSVLAREKLDSLPTDKISLFAPEILLNKFYLLNWRVKEGVEPSEIIVFMNTGGDNFKQLAVLPGGDSYQLPIGFIGQKIDFKLGLKLAGSETIHWSNKVEMLYQPKISIQDVYVKGDYLHLLTQTSGWDEIVTIHLKTKEVKKQSIGFLGGWSCDIEKLKKYPELAVIDRENRDYAKLSEISDYTVKFGSTEYQISDLLNCVKHENGETRLATSIDRVNKIIWLHPYDSYVPRPDIGESWLVYDFEIIRIPLHRQFSLSKKTYRYDRIVLINTIGNVVTYEKNAGKFILYGDDGTEMAIDANVAFLNRFFPSIQYSEEANSLYWFDSRDTMAKLDLQSKLISKIKLGEVEGGGASSVLPNHLTGGYWAIGLHDHRIESNGKKYLDTFVSLYEYDHNGRAMMDTPVVKLIYR